MKENIANMVQKMHETGVAKVAANLSTELSDDKYNKNIITYDASNVGFSYEGDILDLETNSTNNYIRKIWYLFKRIYLVRKIKRNKKINITNKIKLSERLININNKKNDNVIISIRSFPLKDSKGFFHRFIYKYIIKFIYNKADYIIPVSEAIKNDLIKGYGIKEEKIKVLYNFYDIKKIQELAENSIESYPDKLLNSPIYITVGRLTQQKGHWHLIRALKKVIEERFSNAKLIILGQGELKQYLQELVDGLGIKENVLFLGFQDNPYKYIGKADIYVSPSLYEGFPNALNEAMACGIPVISSDCESGPREILSPNMSLEKRYVNDVVYADYGLLVPVCDGELYEYSDPLTSEEITLAQSMIYLYSDKSCLKKYSKLSETRTTDFNKKKIIRKWESVIDN